ncbi:MAG: hypothetical protein R3C45_09215 [Phycisphaerales bacterium]
MFLRRRRPSPAHKLNDGNFHAENSPAINGLRAGGLEPEGAGGDYINTHT